MSSHLRRADGSPLADFQDEVGRRGEEQVDIVADTSAVYAVAMDAAPGTTMPGSRDPASPLGGRRRRPIASCTSTTLAIGSGPVR